MKILELTYENYTSRNEMRESDKSLIAEAEIAAHSSHSPYSHFAVGAALRLKSGMVVRSANIESEVYPAGICAERNALFQSAATYPNDPVEAIAIISTSTEDECYPCGICRQTLLDTERRQESLIRVIMAGAQSATIVESASSLLPFSFKL